MFGMHMDWKASRDAVTNASAVTASGLLDRSSLLRSTGADPVADVTVQPFKTANLVDTQQQGGGGAAMSSFAETQQSGSSSDSGGTGSIEQGPDRMIIVAHLAEDLSWQVFKILCYIPPPYDRLSLMCQPVVDCPTGGCAQVADALRRCTHSSLSVRVKPGAASAAVPTRSAAQDHINTTFSVTYMSDGSSVVEHFYSGPALGPS
jgi:hypothetical protein